MPTDDPRTMRLVLLPDAPSSGPVVDVLRALVSQCLIDPPVLLVEEHPNDASATTFDARTIGRVVEKDIVEPLLHRVASARCERFLLVNVITADGTQPRAPRQRELLSLEEASPSADDEQFGADVPNLQQDADEPANGEPPEVQPAPEVVRALDLDRMIRAALAQRDALNKEVQRLDVVNLVVPASQVGSMPDDLHTYGPADLGQSRGWWNVLVAPEVQATTTQASVEVAPHEQYVAHIAASLVSVAGCWAGATWEPEFPDYAEDGGGGRYWTVMRSRSRSLVAPELPDRVLSRVGRAVGRMPKSDTVEFFPHRKPDQGIELAYNQMVSNHALDHVPFAGVEFRPPRTRVGIKEFFRLLWGWIRGRLPELVQDALHQRVEGIKSSANRAVNTAVGLTPEHDLEISIFTQGAEAIEQPQDLERNTSLEDESKLPGDVTATFFEAEPLVWVSTRNLAFGLLDGGPLADRKVRSLMGEGNRRYVIPEAGLVAPVPGVAVFEPSDAVRELGLGPPATTKIVDIAWVDQWQQAFDDYRTQVGLAQGTGGADAGDTSPTPASEVATDDPVLQDAARFEVCIDDARRSFLWKLCERLYRERSEVDARLTDLLAQMAEVDATTPEQMLAAEGTAKKKKRRAWVRLVLTCLLLVAVVVGVTVLVTTVSIAPLMLIPLMVAFGVGVIFFLMRALLRCIHQWFLADHELIWFKTGRRRVLEEALDVERRQLERFEYLEYTAVEWTEIIAHICHFPFRQPKREKVVRVREPDLHLPISHQVAEGRTLSARLDGIVAAVAKTIVVPGWLGVTYGSSLNYSSEEHRLRAGGGSFRPDTDATVDPKSVGARRALRDAIVAGRARRNREFEVLRTIHESIRTAQGFVLDPNRPEERDMRVEDRLFTPLVDGRTPSGFLTESVVGAPTNFNRAFTPFDVAPDRVAEDASPEVELPTPPTVEQLLENVTIEFPPLAFSTWSIELSGEAPAAELPVFTEVPEPQVLDLERAKTLWLPPPGIDEGEVLDNPPERPDWVLEDSKLPMKGDLIRPVAQDAPGATSGSYTFLEQDDGDPLCHDDNQPVKYAIRRDCAPPNAVEMIMKALQLISNCTGYEFEFEGTFDGLPGARKSERIEIGWSSGEEWRIESEKNSIAYSGTTITRAIGWGGPGGFAVDPRTGITHLVGGSALLCADMSDDYVVGFSGGLSHGMVLLHELGHVMNLGHVESRTEVMHPGGKPSAAKWGPGDVAGLREVAEAARAF